MEISKLCVHLSYQNISDMTTKELLTANRDFVISKIKFELKSFSGESLKKSMIQVMSMTEKYISFFEGKNEVETKKMLHLMVRKVKSESRMSLAELVSGIKEMNGDNRTAAEIRMSHN